MPSSGSGTGTPITSGVGAAVNAQPLPRTHLSLFRYAQIMGIAPLHFAGAVTDTVFPAQGCDSIWPRYSWQDADQVSLEDLAQVIHDAEHDIAAVLGYPVAPQWVAQEAHAWPRHHRRDVWNAGGDVRGGRMGIKAKWARVNTPGRRAVSLIGTATTTGNSLLYQDIDGDGWAERATITMATSLTDANECKVYFSGKSGAQAWEVRPVLSKTISGGVLTIILNSWQLIDPALQSVYPTADGLAAIDASDTDVLVASVDVYREYTDSTQASAQFLWTPDDSSFILGVAICTNCSGSGCDACGLTTQNGCFAVRDAELGIVAPVPATYDDDDARWERAVWTGCREPDQVKLWYLAGHYSDEYLRGETSDPLSDALAHAIAWMATARLERALCQCGNVTGLADHLRQDLVKVDNDTSYYVAGGLAENPFGTKRGEWMAWQRISKLTPAVVSGGAI